jgi:hypothetical protein
MPRLEAAVAEAREKERLAHQAVQAAAQEAINAEQARLGGSFDFSFRLSQLEAEIKKNSPQEIDEFIYEMRKADEKARLELKHGHDRDQGTGLRATWEAQLLIRITTPSRKNAPISKTQ